MKKILIPKIDSLQMALVAMKYAKCENVILTVCNPSFELASDLLAANQSVQIRYNPSKTVYHLRDTVII